MSKPAGKYPWDGVTSCSTGDVGYLSSAKIAEAKNMLGAIARDAVASFEREQIPVDLLTASSAPVVAHALCKTSDPIPAAVPSGTKTNPSEAWLNGDDQTGWKCLRFAVSDPIYFQYRYAQGKGYVGPARGLPDPGPDGFEASAQRDLNGDGKTSLFTRIGVIDKQKNEVVLAPDLTAPTRGSEPGVSPRPTERATS